jgi:hypothetical protein
MTEAKVIQTHSSGWLDHVRMAIFALQLASELTQDEEDLAHTRGVIKELQEGLVAHARRRQLPKEDAGSVALL